MNDKILLLSKIFTMSSEAIFTIGIPLAILDKGASIDIFSLSIATQIFMYMIASLIGGTLGDRSHSFLLPGILTLVRALTVLFTVGFFYDLLTPTHLIIFSGASSFFGSIYSTQIDSMTIRELSSKSLSQFLRYSTIATQFFDTIGYVIGGALITIIGFQSCFMLSAFFLFIPFFLLFPYYKRNNKNEVPLSLPKSNPDRMTSFKKLIRNSFYGFEITLKIPAVRTVLTLAMAINIFSAAQTVFWIPEMKKMGLKPDQIGLICGITTLFASFPSFFVKKHFFQNVTWPIVCTWAQGLSFLGGMISISFWNLWGLSIGASFILAANLLHGISSSMIRKEAVPPINHGAALAAARIISRIFVPIIFLLIGWASKSISERHIFIVATIPFVLLSVGALSSFPLYKRILQ